MSDVVQSRSLPR